MADTVAPQRRSEIMSNIQAKDMKPEMQVRRLVHSMGYRYRLHRKDLPGKPDRVFPGRRKVIFVHGCFWHQHADPVCKIVRLPQSNRDYWWPKLERNTVREAEQEAKLGELDGKYSYFGNAGLGMTLVCGNGYKDFLMATVSAR